MAIDVGSGDASNILLLRGGPPFAANPVRLTDRPLVSLVAVNLHLQKRDGPDFARRERTAVLGNEKAIPETPASPFEIDDTEFAVVEQLEQLQGRERRFLTLFPTTRRCHMNAAYLRYHLGRNVVEGFDAAGFEQAHRSFLRQQRLQEFPLGKEMPRPLRVNVLLTA